MCCQCGNDAYAYAIFYRGRSVILSGNGLTYFPSNLYSLQAPQRRWLHRFVAMGCDSLSRPPFVPASAYGMRKDVLRSFPRSASRPQGRAVERREHYWVGRVHLPNAECLMTRRPGAARDVATAVRTISALVEILRVYYQSAGKEIRYNRRRQLHTGTIRSRGASRPSPFAVIF